MPPKRKSAAIPQSSDIENEVSDDHESGSDMELDFPEDYENDEDNNYNRTNGKDSNVSRTKSQNSHRAALQSSNEQPSNRRTSNRKKQKVSDSKSVDVQKLLRKNAELEDKLWRAKIRQGKTAQHSSMQDELESEEETLPTIQLKPTATPLPSISTPKPPMLNLTQIASKKPKKISRNTYQSIVSESLVSPATPSPRESPMDKTSELATSNTDNDLFSGTTDASHEHSPDASSVRSPVSAHHGAIETPPSQTPTSAPTLTLIGEVKGRAKASDYGNGGEALILRAVRDYEARIIGVGFFPDPSLQGKWAEECFRGACEIAKQTYNSDKPIIKLITSRGSRIRSKAFNYIRTKVETCYQFDSSGKKKSIRKNQLLYQKLTERDFNAFLYKKREHPNIIVFLGYIFESRMALAFEIYFSTISLSTLACVFTMVRVTLTEWSTGKLEKIKKFSEQDFKAHYTAYLKDLELWHSMNPSFSLKLRSRMFNKVKAKFTGETKAHVTAHISGSVEEELRVQMKNRTGDTSEESSESDLEPEEETATKWGLVYRTTRTTQTTQTYIAKSFFPDALEHHRMVAKIPKLQADPTNQSRRNIPIKFFAASTPKLYLPQTGAL
ncbi:hypothetical protein C8R42DRAFT_724119 [Lentinula raphanica]|nr:hypothetical protein C8R42DRAFT_724119 [Lentinula raphanica]